MALVGYSSSDGEDEEIPQTQQQAPTSGPSASSATKIDPTSTSNPNPPPQSQPQSTSSQPVTNSASIPPVLGPALGPARPPPTTNSSYPESDLETSSLRIDATSEPLSPYTAHRTLLRDLTLPAMPNMTIPPSPPGTPPPSAAALTQKFEHFLALKREKGVHFNARLGGSMALRNPALMDKLMGFVGLGSEEDGEWGRQYETTLTAEGDGKGEGGNLGWDVRDLPAWARRDGLRRAQERVGKERERKMGEKVEFVSAGTGTENGNGASVPAPASVTGKRKTRFDA